MTITFLGYSFKPDESHIKIDENWRYQNKFYYYWSESNFQFERAWWLYTNKPSPLLNSLKKERPLPVGCTIYSPPGTDTINIR